MEPDDTSHLGGCHLVQLLHCPMANKCNVYDTESPRTREWLAHVFRQLGPTSQLPILVHCRHGRDRTGVVIAVLLMILGVHKNVIMQEFLLTEGAKMTDLERSFAGVRARGGIEKYFEGMLDLDVVRGLISLEHVQGSRRRHYREALQATKHKQDSSLSCESLLEVCEHGVKLAPNDVEMHAALGWALLRLGRHEEAHQAFRQGLHLATFCSVKPEIVRMMTREIEALQVNDRICRQSEDE
jgi:hypothetical protein